MWPTPAADALAVSSCSAEFDSMGKGVRGGRADRGGRRTTELAAVRIEEWPRRADTTGNATPSARRCDVCVCRSEWRLVPFGSYSGRTTTETAADTESGLSGDPSGLAKIKSPAW